MTVLDVITRAIGFVRELDKRTGVLQSARDVAVLYASSGGDVTKAIEELRRRLVASGDEAERRLDAQEPDE